MKKRTRWTEEMLRAEALKYATKVGFQKGSSSAYALARHRGIVDSICSHMVPLRTEWTIEKLKIEAGKYKTRGEFRKANPRAYSTAHKWNVVDDICQHMTYVRNYWDSNSIADQAIKYETRVEFMNSCPQAYNAAQRNGLIDDVCRHMRNIRDIWTKELIEEEAKKYTERLKFRDGAPGAYSSAHRNGWLDEICDHMEQGESGFDATKPAVMYFVQIDHPTIPQQLCKIGITNRTATNRVSNIGFSGEVKRSIIKVVSFESGAEAREEEKRIHQKYGTHYHKGAHDFMKNGFTEVFVMSGVVDLIQMKASAPS